MAAMFEVEFASKRVPESAFTVEIVMASDATDAIARAAKRVGAKMMRQDGGLFPTNVKVLGWES